jgi:rSAM/selenodomain-associated transferase 2
MSAALSQLAHDHHPANHSRPPTGRHAVTDGEQLTVSVVVPVLNEAGRIEPLLGDMASIGFHEIIVVDGGSSDGTAALVERIPAVRLLSASGGRGVSLDAGLRAATGDVVLFLHADTRLPPDGIAAVRAALSHPDVSGGSFRLAFDRDDPGLCIFAWLTRFETALTTFGDQAMFARRTRLLAAGGIRAWPILEDVELRRTLKHSGRFVKLPLAVVTSARRFEATGIWRQQMRNILIMAAFWSGVSPQRLADYYRPHVNRTQTARPSSSR